MASVSVWKLHERSRDHGPIASSADGGLLAVVATDRQWRRGAVKLLRVSDGRWLETRFTDPDAAGEKIALGFRADGAPAVATNTGVTFYAPASVLAFSPDGRILAWAARRYKLRVFEVGSATTGSRLRRRSLETALRWIRLGST